MERNLMYQNAVMERDVKKSKPKKSKRVLSSEEESEIPVRNPRHLKKPKTKLKMVHSSDSESIQIARNMQRSITPSLKSSNSSIAKMRHLPKRFEKKYPDFDERKHFKYLGEKKSKKVEQPSFKNYRESKEETISE